MVQPAIVVRGLALAILSTGAMGFSPPFVAAPRGTGLFFSSLSVQQDTSVDVAENAARNTFAFDLWANNNGIQRVDGFKLVDEGGERDLDRQVYATTTTDVPSGSPVLFVPEALILSSNKAIAELRGPEMEEVELYLANAEAETQYRQYYLMLKILLEVQKGRESQWYQWLDSLPRFFTNACSMTDFCLLCLPPLMKKLAEEERESQERLGTESIAMVPFLGDDIKNNPRLVKWAYQIAYTRAVETDDGDLQIVPMGDYFDHGSESVEIQPSYDDAGNYYAYTTYDVSAGQPLRISYADPRNPSHLFARYGFLDEESPATYCKLLPPTVNQDMLDLGYSHDRMLFYKSGEVADEVWDIFLYTHLSATNLDDQQALMTAHRTGDYESKLALHEAYYVDTSAALLDHVDGFLEDIDKLIEKADTIGVTDPNSVYIRFEHPRLPLIHRHNLFVRETFQNVRNRYSPDESWREATRLTVQECDDTECAVAECVQTFDGNWMCEGGLGPNPDGSERMKTQTVIASQ
ncbi:hypothetical protein ACHAXT_011349 [Thalassiosira profunda]